MQPTGPMRLKRARDAGQHKIVSLYFKNRMRFFCSGYFLCNLIARFLTLCCNVNRLASPGRARRVEHLELLVLSRGLSRRQLDLLPLRYNPDSTPTIQCIETPCNRISDDSAILPLGKHTKVLKAKTPKGIYIHKHKHIHVHSSEIHNSKEPIKGNTRNWVYM